MTQEPRRIAALADSQAKVADAPAAEIKPTTAVGLEEALEIVECGFFHFKLLVGLWLAMAVQNFVTTDIAYALPAAQCDLQLTAMERGWINAAAFVGMLTTAFAWGALSDILGRKWLLMTGYLSMAVVCTATAFVSSSWGLIACRMILGALLIGPVSMALTYVGELFATQYRSKVFMWAGTMQALAAAAHAGLAMWIIPLPLQWIRSWRLFLLVTAVTNACAGSYLFLLPESPKYLASRGLFDEALKVLARIYAANSGQPAEMYPVKSLTMPKDPQDDDSRSSNPCVSIGRQFAKLCRKPFRTPLLFVVAMQPLILFSQNTMRLWVPQIFAQMDSYASTGSSAERDVCFILEDNKPQGNYSAAIASAKCDTYRVDASVYLNSIIIMTSRAIVQLVASFIVQPLGPTTILFGSLILAGSTLAAWPWARTATAFLSLVCVFEGAANTAFSAFLNIIVDLFPTGVRSAAFSLSNFSGRAGSVVGNVAMPMLFVSKCYVAFWIGASTYGVAALVALLKPRPAFTPTPSTGLAKAVLAANAARRHTK